MKLSHRLGKRGEDYSAGLLQANGYKIIGRNFTSRFGEIDIIASKGNTLVFVEVKTRSSRVHGLPEEAVTPAKLTKITAAAEYYLLTNPSKLKKYRIDVVAIEVNNGIVTRAKIIKVY